MMCQRIGRPPTSTMGFGRNSVSSRRRVPKPPHKMTTFTKKTSPKRQPTHNEEPIIIEGFPIRWPGVWRRVRECPQHAACRRSKPATDMLRLTCLRIRRQTLSCSLARQRLAWRSRSGGSRSARRASKKRDFPWEVGLNPIRALAFLAAAISAIAQSDTPATSAAADSRGPAILSRGEAPAAMSIPEISFRPFVEFAGVYDTGLTGVAINSNGQLGTSVSPGIVLTGGVSGAHSWKHTKVGVDYHGSVYDYTKTTY